MGLGRCAMTGGGRESGRCNRLIKFIKERLPVLVIWELWVQYTSSRYGSGGFLWLGSFLRLSRVYLNALLENGLSGSLSLQIGSLCSERQKGLGVKE